MSVLDSNPEVGDRLRYGFAGAAGAAIGITVVIIGGAVL
jgi:hypothetical protein